MKMKRGWWLVVSFALAGVIALAGAAPLAGQKKKKKEASSEQAKAELAAEAAARPTDDRAIDLAISEMLGAWQVGDVELLRKHYADDVMVVSGAWEPPLIGWENFLRAYRSQRERMQSGQLNRRNTFISVRGNLAWAFYQWDFAAMVDGKPTGARGHTTLVFEKRKDQWLIVQNHTSLVQQTDAPQTAPAPAAPKPSAPGEQEPEA